MSNIPNIPNQKPYKDLTPFDLVLIQKFPFIEEDFDGINLYGILSKIKDSLNTTIANQETVQKNQADLYNYVNTYFTNLDVQEEINNKLDEMAESGVLSTLIFKRDFYKFSNLNVRRIARWILDNGKNNINYDDTIPYFANAQGSCIIDENTIAIAYTPSDDNFKLSDKTLIRIYSLSTGNVLREAEFDFGHANGMIYKDGKLLITECFTRNNTNDYNYSTNIYVIDVDSLSYIETKTINTSSTDMFLNISYDKTTEKMYAMQRFIVHELDDEFNIVNTINLKQNDIVDKGTYQTIHAHNGNFYVVQAYPNQIIVYDNLGDIIQYYKIPDWAEDSFFVGEMEDISFIDEDIYMTSHKSLCENSDANVTQVFILNTSINKSVYDTNKTNPVTRKRLVVNKTSRLNPDGSSNNGFNELAEAIEFSLSPKGINVSYISLEQGIYRWCFISNLKNSISINCSNNTKINGLSIMYCNNLRLNNAIVGLTNNSDLAGNNIISQYSNLILDTVTYEIVENFNTLLNIRYGILELYNSTPNNLTDDITFISAGPVSTLKYRGEIKNIKSSGNYTNIGNYPITDDLSLKTGNITKNSFLTNQNININDILYTNKHLLFKYRDGSNKPMYTVANTQYISTNNFKLCSVEVTSDNYYINEMIIHLESNQFSITSNKSIDKTGTELETPRLILNKIYSYND